MNLRELLDSDKQFLFLDGAMGTQLGQMGLEMGGQNDVTNPDAVLAVHRRYVEAGVDLLITNTLTMNGVNLESHNVGIDMRQVNLAGARLAREAAAGGPLVLGDMSSTGKMLKPYGPLPEDDATRTFTEQALVLAEGGVDGFIIETMFDLREALLALKAVKQITELPVIASITFNTVKNGGRTVMGNTAEDSARALTEAGADVVGINCGSIDPFEVAELVAVMKGVTDVPIIAQPNAGRGRMVDKELVFDMTPADFAQGVKACADAGARLLGGCCGTSPEHIAAMVRLLS